MSRALLSGACVATGLLVAGTASAATFAVVVGIDRYAHQENLEGSVADAVDIAHALRFYAPPENIVLLRNAVASRDAIEGAFNRLLARAAPGDTLLFSFSGHGSQEEDSDGDEARTSGAADLHDEVLLLSGASAQSAAGLRERLVDDTLHEWFLRAKSRGVRVVFLADSCYSGQSYRNAGSGRPRRTVDPFAIPEAEKALKRSRPSPEVAEGLIEGMLFISGGRETQVVHEAMIAGRRRGAVSYVFARALDGEGKADLNGDGVLTRGELAAYIPDNARIHNKDQDPRVQPDRGADFPVFRRLTVIADPALNGTAPEPAPAPSLTPAVSGGIVLESGGGDITWDPSNGDVIDGDGERVAYGVPERQLTEITEKFRLIEALKRAALAGSIRTRLLHDGNANERTHPEGRRLDFEIGPFPYPYVTAFNLGNDGRVQPLIPDAGYDEDGAFKVGQSHRFPVVITEPFGADHIVVIVSRTPPERLRQLLRSGTTAGALISEITRLGRAGAVAFGLHPIYSTEK